MSRLRFLAQDARWALELFRRELEKRFLLPRMSIPSGTPDLYDEVAVEKNMAVLARDGVRLFADLYKPRAEGRFPVVLTRMPGGKSEAYCYMPAIGRFWARKGYAFVVQDVRGKWESEGRWEPFVNEASDGYDTLDWIARQPWCDGNVGMMGESYYGYTTWAAATTGHPNLKCISPSTTAMDIYGVWIYNSGAFCLQALGTWAIETNAQEHRNPLRPDYERLPLTSMDVEAGISCETYQDWLLHPTRDSYWDPINLCQKYGQIRIPVLHVGGWYDAFLQASIEDWVGVRNHSVDVNARENQWLMIGPWDHNFSTDDSHRIGQLSIGDGCAVAYWDRCQAFFDHWLKGATNGFDQSPRVDLFTIGANEWRTGDEWPPAGTAFRDFFFHSGGGANQGDGDGSLTLTPPTGAEPADIYYYNPVDPITLTKNVDIWSRAEYLQDRARLPERPDVLVHDTAPLEEDLEITGPIVVKLFASSSAVDTDFTAALVDLYPSGYAHLIQEGIVRTSYRESDREPSPIEPGRVYGCEVDLWATSHVVKEGHRIRVETSSSNFNRFDRNPNTGEPMGTAVSPIPANQQVFHTAEYPSRINLPIQLGQGGS